MLWTGNPSFNNLRLDPTVGPGAGTGEFRYQLARVDVTSGWWPFKTTIHDIVIFRRTWGAVVADNWHYLLSGLPVEDQERVSQLAEAQKVRGFADQAHHGVKRDLEKLKNVFSQEVLERWDRVQPLVECLMFVADEFGIDTEEIPKHLTEHLVEVLRKDCARMNLLRRRGIEPEIEGFME